jgi:hypothetical protein
MSGNGFVDAARRLGFTRRFLAGQPQRHRQFDLVFLLALIAVDPVVQAADADRAGLGRQSGRDILRSAGFGLAGIQSRSLGFKRQACSTAIASPDFGVSAA